MKTFYKFAILVVVFVLSTTFANAVVNPETIQWRANNNPVFLNSLYQGVLGRAPTQAEINTALQRLNSQNGWKMARGEAFWSLLGSQEYRNRFGTSQGDYQVLFKSQNMRVDWSNRTWCNCYFFTKEPSVTGGLRPVMQYTGSRTPWSSYTFSVARAVTRMFAVFDADSCPSVNCGMNGGDVAAFFARNRGNNNNNNNSSTNNANLVRDPNFANFRSGANWGRGVLYGQNGIWWNSRNAGSTARVVNLNGGNIPTALRIVNPSGSSAHVYGTTAQRIKVNAGRIYRISFWGKATNLRSGSGITITVDPQWKIRPVSMVSGTYNWKKFTGTFTAPSNYVDLRIISQDRCDEVLITDMSLVQIQ